MRKPDRNLRVGLVAPAFDKGGLESVVFGLYEHLKRNGHQATVFVENSSVGYFADRLGAGDLAVLDRRADAFFAEIAARRINVLHYHYSTFMLPEMRSLGIGAIYTLHNVYTWLDSATFRARAEAIDCCDAVTAVSTYARDYYARRAGSTDADIAIIPNGVDVEALRTAAPIARTRFAIPEDRYLFAQFSSFHRVKHHMALVRAAEKLYARRRDFHVAFFGNVGDRQYHDEIRQAINASPARDHFSLPGYLNEDEVAGVLLGAVDCAMMTTLQEGCGNAALEAAAVGRPVIMTDTGVARDLERSGADIEVVPTACDVDRLTLEEIERLSRDGRTPNLPSIVAAMTRRIGEGRRPRAASKADFEFSIGPALRQFETLYAASARLV
ncbi:MAG: glycosyltransferase family 4 protein [Hyphomicrobiales bacterium]|nr:glycosyltransferase family 4 protein [Hyphomicrobiales bacterium]